MSHIEVYSGGFFFLFLKCETVWKSAEIMLDSNHRSERRFISNYIRTFTESHTCCTFKSSPTRYLPQHVLKPQKQFKSSKNPNPTSLPPPVQSEALPRYFPSIFPSMRYFLFRLMHGRSAQVYFYIFVFSVVLVPDGRRWIISAGPVFVSCGIVLPAVPHHPASAPPWSSSGRSKQTDNTDRVDWDRTQNANRVKLSSACEEKM